MVQDFCQEWTRQEVSTPWRSHDPWVTCQNEKAGLEKECWTPYFDIHDSLFMEWSAKLELFSNIPIGRVLLCLTILSHRAIPEILFSAKPIYASSLSSRTTPNLSSDQKKQSNNSSRLPPLSNEYAERSLAWLGELGDYRGWTMGRRVGSGSMPRIIITVLLIPISSQLQTTLVLTQR